MTRPALHHLADELLQLASVAWAGGVKSLEQFARDRVPTTATISAKFAKLFFRLMTRRRRATILSRNARP
jgi:hypothetical protein